MSIEDTRAYRLSMINDRIRTLRKLIAWFIIYSHVLTGCAVNDANSGAIKAGPQFSSSLDEETPVTPNTVTELDVIIPVFDPGLTEKAENYEEEGIWPELRRAEANRFAYKLKQALDESEAFGAVRVAPDSTASGDLYVLGKIKESDGEKIKFNLNVTDISGKKWLDKDFNYTVEESFYKNVRKKGTDPYDPVFEQAANEIVQLLKGKDQKELDNLKTIADLRFGASFNDEAFMQYLSMNGDQFKLVSKPSDNDPMLQRISVIRVREQMFIDNLQQSYSSFSSKMDESYLKWQEASFTEKKLREEAETEGALKALGGLLLIGLAIAAATSGSSSGNLSDLKTTGVVASGVAGAWMLSSSFKSREEAELHKDAIDELGESINIEIAPQVMNFEEETLLLTGDVQEQFSQWRSFLRRIYEQETSPSMQF